jgi:hypothetical protein
MVEGRKKRRRRNKLKTGQSRCTVSTLELAVGVNHASFAVVTKRASLVLNFRARFDRGKKQLF